MYEVAFTGPQLFTIIFGTAIVAGYLTHWISK